MLFKQLAGELNEQTKNCEIGIDNMLSVQLALPEL